MGAEIEQALLRVEEADRLLAEVASTLDEFVMDSMQLDDANRFVGKARKDVANALALLQRVNP